MKTLYLLLLAACLPLAFMHSQTTNTQIPDTDREVLAAVRQGNFLYIGGAFTNVGGTPRNGLARINMTTNTLDNSWNPDVYNGTFGSNGIVKGMAFSPDGSILYIGGFFDKIGGATGTDRVCLAAINVATAAATSWNASTASVFDEVKSLLVSTSSGDVYVQGSFTSIYEPSTMTTFTRNGLACISAAGLVTAFDPQCSNTNAFREFAISSDNSRIYIGFGNSGADFTDGMGGTVHRNQFAELNAMDGVPTSFDPNPDAGVFAIIQSGASLYLCGGFTTIDGMARDHVAKFNNALTTPTLDATFTSGINGSIRGAFFDGSNLYVLGDFKKAGATCIESLAKLDATTGEALNTWRVGANNYTTQTNTKLRGSTTHQQLYAVGYGGNLFSFLGRSARRFHVFNYASTNTLTETGIETADSATPITFEFTGTSMILDVDQVNDVKCLFANRYTDAPQNVSGITQSNISNYRFVFRFKNLFASTMTLRFKLNDLPSPPATTHIYYRNTPNEGAFTDAGTVTYNVTNNTLSIDALFLSTQEPVEFVFASDAVLPIEFSEFSVQKQVNTVLITWATADEGKHDKFEVQRSNDGIQFQAIHEIAAKGQASTYEFVDKEPLNGISYYRILSQNTEGGQKTTKTKSIVFSMDKPNVRIYPNPTADVIYIQNLSNQAQTLILTNAAGQIVKQLSDATFLNMSDLPNGVYVLTVTTENSYSTHKIQKQY